MRLHRQVFSVAVGITFVAGAATAAWAADSLKSAQALAQGLTFSPVQSLVEYTIPSKDEASKCTIQPEKEANGTAWVVRNGKWSKSCAASPTPTTTTSSTCGATIWTDSKCIATSIRTSTRRRISIAGSIRPARAGDIDENEDGRIDAWRTISPHEVAEQVVIALKTRDASAVQPAACDAERVE